MAQKQKLRNFCIGVVLVLGLFTGYKVLSNGGLEKVSDYNESIHQEGQIAQGGEDKTLFPMVSPVLWMNLL